jgi:hypothetical protein
MSEHKATELPEAYAKIVTYENKQTEIIISAKGYTTIEALGLFKKIQKAIKE